MAVTLNPSDKHSDIDLSNGNMTAGWPGGHASAGAGVRATQSHATGKYYFEVYADYTLGWEINQFGIATSAAGLGFPGDDAYGWGYKSGNGKKYHNGSNSAYGDDWETDGDVIGIAVDIDAGKIWFSKNGVWQDSGDPAAGTGEAFSSVSGTIFPFVGMYLDGLNAQPDAATARFTETDFSYSIPSGFIAWDDFDKVVEAGIGFEAVVAVETLSDTIEAGIGIQSQAGVEATFSVDVAAGVGIQAQVVVNGIFLKAVSAGIGIEAEAEVFNWAQWLSIYGNRYTARYYLTLTGAPDDLSDVVIPISSFQYRLRDDTPSYLQVVIPGIDYATDITNRPNGELIVEMAYLVAGVEQHREQLARVDLEDVQLHEGPRNKSIILVGHRTETWGAQIVTLRGITYQSDKNGLIRIRCAEPDLFLRPGNTVKAGDETFIAGQVATSVSKSTQWMEVVEAA